MVFFVALLGVVHADCVQDVEVTYAGAEPRSRLEYDVREPSSGLARSWWRDIEGNRVNGRPVSDVGPLGQDVEFDVQVVPTSDGFALEWALRGYVYSRSRRDHDEVFNEDPGGLRGRIDYDRSGRELSSTKEVSPSTRWLKLAAGRAGSFVYELPDLAVGSGATWRVVRRCGGHTSTEDVSLKVHEASRVYLSGLMSSVDHPDGKEVQFDEETRIVKVAGAFWREWRTEVDLRTVSTNSFVAQDGWIDNTFVRTDGDKGQFLARVSWYATDAYEARVGPAVAPGG
jgi:hypothetical protein